MGNVNVKLSEVEREFRETTCSFFDVYHLWTECLSQASVYVYNSKNVIETEAFLVLLFFPLDIFDLPLDKKIEVATSKAENTILTEERIACFVDYFANNVLRKRTEKGELNGDAHWQDIVKHHPYIDHPNYHGYGNSKRKKYCDYIKNYKNYSEHLQSIVDVLHCLILDRNKIDIVINYYFFESDYLKNLDEKVKPYEDNKISFEKIIKEQQQNDDKYEVLAKLIICLGLGEQVLNCVDFIFVSDKNIHTTEDYYRCQLIDCYEQSDYKSLVRLLQEIDNNFFENMDNVNIANKKSKDFFYVARIYEKGCDINKDTKIEKNIMNAGKAFLNCIKLFKDEENEKDLSYMGYALFWLLQNNQYPFDDVVLTKKFGDKPIEVLTQSMEYGNVDAALVLGRKYENGDVEEGIEKNVSKALDIYLNCEQPIALTSAIRIIKGYIEDNEENYVKYKNIVKKAAESFVEDAIDIINEHEDISKIKKNSHESDRTSIYIIIGDNRENRFLINSLTGRNHVYLFVENIGIANTKAYDSKKMEGIQVYSIADFDHVIKSEIPVWKFNCENDLLSISEIDLYFVAMGREKQDNLRYVTGFIDLCINRYYTIKHLLADSNRIEKEVILNYFNSNTKIAANIDRDEGEIYLTRLQTREKNVVIPIRFISYYEEASFDLLWSKAPLFSIKMGTKRTNHNNFVLLTDSMDVIPLINNILSVMYYGDDAQRYKLRVVGPVAQSIESYLQIYENAIFEEHDDRDRLELIEFIKVEFDDANVWNWEKMIDGKSGNVINALRYADFIICACEHEEDNIKIAELLRKKEILGKLEFQNSNYNDTCQIACMCRNNNLTKETRGFYADTHYTKYPWYSGYNLIGFGDMREIYSYDNVFGSIIEKLAYKMHEAYYIKDGNIDSKSAHKDYYASIYNMDSSKINALYTLYHFYTAGLLDNVTNWDCIDIEKRLIEWSELFRKTLEKDIEKHSAIQHEQWVMFMKTRGFSCASVSQMRNYIGNGNPKHHSLKVAKLHPYMVRWEEIGYTAEEFKKKYNSIIKKYIDNLDEKCIENLIISNSDLRNKLISFITNGIEKNTSLNTMVYEYLKADVDILAIRDLQDKSLSKQLLECFETLKMDIIHHVENCIISGCDFIKFDDNIPANYKEIEEMKASLNSILKRNEWLKQYYMKVGSEKNYKEIRKENIIKKVSSLYEFFFVERIGDNELIKYLWCNIRDISNSLNENFYKDIDTIKKISEQNDISEQEKEIIKDMYNLLRNRRKMIGLIRILYDFNDPSSQEDMNVVNKYKEDNEIRSKQVYKIKTMMDNGIQGRHEKDVLEKILLFYQYNMSEYVNKCINIYEKMVEILENKNSLDNSEATGLQKNMDDLMKAMNLPLLGSIRENDIRMVKKIPENYRELIREMQSGRRYSR